MPDECRYNVTLRQGNQAVGPEFICRQLPAPGLLFEHKSRKYRVEEVCLLVPPTADQEAQVVECDVAPAYDWDKEQGRWAPVAS
ncbi:hypothetical protein [Streptomyces tendae]